jgi:hypothetical protein
MLSTEVLAAIISGVAVVAFGGGFMISDWRSDGEIEKLRADSQLLQSANRHCLADLKTVNTAVNNMIDAAAQRERNAQEAMREVQPQLERRKATITRIRSLPPVPVDRQCEAIQTEQIAYVQERREEAQ